MGKHEEGHVAIEDDDVATISTSDSDRTEDKTPPRERPEALSLFLEFIKMSRTSAILLIAFVLTAALYMFVRQDPVVAFGSPPRADSSQTDSSEPASDDADGQSVTDQPTGVTESGQSETPTTADPSAGEDSMTSAAETSVPVGQRGADSDGGAATEQTQQPTQVPQTSASSAPSGQTNPSQAPAQ